MAENFPKPAANPRTYLSKTSVNQRKKENPLKSCQRHKFKKRQNQTVLIKDAYIESITLEKARNYCLKN